MAEQTDKQTDRQLDKKITDEFFKTDSNLSELVPALKKAKGGKKASLPDVMDQDIFDDTQKTELSIMLERGLELKNRIGVQPDEKKGTPGSGLLKDIYDLKQQLGEHAASNGLEGLRFGHIVYTQRLQDGRKILDTEKLCQELLTHGVKAEVIGESIKAATKQGESFWVREIASL